MCTCPNGGPSMARAKSACVIRPATSSPFLKCRPPPKTARSREDRATDERLPSGGKVRKSEDLAATRSQKASASGEAVAGRNQLLRSRVRAVEWIRLPAPEVLDA